MRARFAQHEDIRSVLLDAGNVLIDEHTIKDRFWGDGSGKNWFGQDSNGRVRRTTAAGCKNTRSMTATTSGTRT